MTPKRSLTAVLVLAILGFMAGIRPVAATTSSVNVWWPVDGAQVTGSQPFKAMLNGMNVENYQMFWQVDGGSWVWMDNNYNGYPHKEAQVDLSGWNWHGAGPYKVNFIARYSNGTIIAEQAVNIYIGQNVTYGGVRDIQPSQVVTPTPSPSATPVTLIVNTPSPTPIPVSTPTPPPSVAPTPSQTPVSSSGNPLAGAKLYINQNSDPANWVTANQNTDPSDAQLMEKIASQPESEWFGDWNSNVYQDAKNTTNQVVATGATPVFVIYDIPERDCGGYSSGGATSADAYKTWINNLVAGIGGQKAVAIVEPDALAGMDCLSGSDQAQRMSLISYAVGALESHGIAAYIDAGNPNWISASVMAQRLKAAGIDQAHGFSLNVSNFYTTSANEIFGTQLSADLAALGSLNKHFVIDTSRNGSGPTSDYQWCNPSGRSLGQKPTVNTGNPLVDAYLWVKGPGGSDGTCNGGPSAGVFWPSYALDLARNTLW